MEKILSKGNALIYTTCVGIEQHPQHHNVNSLLILLKIVIELYWKDEEVGAKVYYGSKGFIQMINSPLPLHN